MRRVSPYWTWLKSPKPEALVAGVAGGVLAHPGSHERLRLFLLRVPLLDQEVANGCAFSFQEVGGIVLLDTV